MIHDTQSAQISWKQDDRNIYAIMNTVFTYLFIYTLFKVDLHITL